MTVPRHALKRVGRDDVARQIYKGNHMHTFKTLEGAKRRAAFESAHSKTSRYVVTRLLDGVKDETPFNRNMFSRYQWRVERTQR